jgi:hypothetical protein
MGYSYPDTKEKAAYFPDKFIAWGTYWTDFPEFPLDKKDVILGGFSHFSEKYQKYAHIQRESKQIVVISQASICQPLAAVILKEIESLSDYQIVYKLHPSEYESFREVPELMKMLKYPNFSIQQNCDLYALFAASQYAVGVYSTALYEAMGLGCTPIIVQAPGWEMMTDLIKRYNIRVVTPETPLHQIIRDVGPANIDVEELFFNPSPR